MDKFIKGYDLKAALFFSDPRVKEAQELLLNALKEHKLTVNAIAGPKSSLKISYEEHLSDFANLRGAKLFYPYLGSGFGSGPFVELMDGSIKYDFATGVGPHFLGHNHEITLKSGLQAALENTVMQGNLQQNYDSYLLCQKLVELSGIEHCFLTTTGAMANENALKIAFQKRFPASRILAFDKCFAGRTLSASQITDKPNFREGLPLNLQVDYVPFYDSENPDLSLEISLNALKKHLNRYPGQHAAMLFELVLGEGGFYTGTEKFFKALMEVLKEHKIVIISDEVQAFARTTELFAFQAFGLSEYVDIVTIGKISQACATLFKTRLIPKPGLLSQTFTASSSAIQASLAILDYLQTGNFFGQDGINQKLHSCFENGLKALEKKLPGYIKGPYGIGSMVAFTPFSGSNEEVYLLAKKMFDHGVICFTAGSHPTRIRFLLPTAVTTPTDIDNVIEILEKSLVEINNEHNFCEVK